MFFTRLLFHFFFQFDEVLITKRWLKQALLKLLTALRWSGVGVNDVVKDIFSCKAIFFLVWATNISVFTSYNKTNCIYLNSGYSKDGNIY